MTIMTIEITFQIIFSLKGDLVMYMMMLIAPFLEVFDSRVIMISLYSGNKSIIFSQRFDELLLSHAYEYHGFVDIEFVTSHFSIFITPRVIRFNRICPLLETT